ncbi:MAG TPA: bifunctional nuclease domain-containing protein [archaeon]|nr:bifunctional nuclease domain-containing protein [archaeon]
MKLPTGLFLLIFVVLIAGLFAIAQLNNFDSNGYAEADVIQVQGKQTLVLGANCTGIVADTTEERALAIQSGIDKKIEERPSIYDNYIDTMKSFNISVERVTFDRYDGNYYYSNIFLRGSDKLLKIDAKPSDAIAVALKANATVFINKSLLAEVGKNIC